MINSTNKIIAKLGQPKDSTAELYRLQLPFSMKIAWDEKTIINSFLCHPIIHTPLKAVLQELLVNYSLEQIDQLRINRFGGCYSYRRMRNSSKWSSHAWAIAVDLDPVKNALKMTNSEASFAKPEYKKMNEIFYKNGFKNLGIEANYDYMHFEYFLK